MQLPPPRKGFTLAEVLITLSIISVVAVITIPSLVNNYKEKAIIYSLKKNFSILNNSYKLASIKYGTPDNWGLNTTLSTINGKDNSNIIMKNLSENLNTIKKCPAQINSSTKCAPKKGYSYVFNKNGETTVGHAYWISRAILNDETIIYVEYRKPNFSDKYPFYAIIDVDVNGFKGPNQYGYDLFSFWLTKDGIEPRGDQIKKIGNNSFRSNCGNQFQGTSCTAWVLYKENMEYLRCNDLDWNTKTTCK